MHGSMVHDMVIEPRRPVFSRRGTYLIGNVSKERSYTVLGLLKLTIIYGGSVIVAWINGS